MSGFAASGHLLTGRSKIFGILLTRLAILLAIDYKDVLLIAAFRLAANLHNLFQSV